MKNKLAAAVAFALLAGAGSTAFAQAKQQQSSSGWYIGGSVGRSSVNISNGDMDSTAAYLRTVGVTGISYSKDETDTGFKGFLGYQVNPNFGIEVGYADLGKFNAKFNGTFAAAAGSVNVEVEGQAWFGDLVLTAPLSREAAVFAKLGVNSIKAKGNATVSWPALSAAVSQSDTNSGGHFGVGASYYFTPQVGIRGEWERFKGAKITSQSSEGDIDLLSVGLQIRF